MTALNKLPILVETRECVNGRQIGVLTLNAPESINALTAEMVDMLYRQLRLWQHDASVACVVLRGVGDKGLCAGGDVLALRASSLAQDDRAESFFIHEYRLDYLIHVYAKPILVWGHGVVMGGGLGLLAGASHRVVTRETRLAMPEVTIGLFPDVGASWFLNRMPGRTGMFLALTGAVMNAGDALHLGLGDYCLEHAQWDAVLRRLRQVAWSNDAQNRVLLHDMLSAFSTLAGALPASNIRKHTATIQAMTEADSCAGVVAAICSYTGDDAWLVKAVNTLKTGCPTSMAIIYEQLRRTKKLDLAAVFQLELVVATHCVRSANFAEGVRALLVDKDRKPCFVPASLNEVKAEDIAAYFERSWSEGNPLNSLLSHN